MPRARAWAELGARVRQPRVRLLADVLRGRRDEPEVFTEVEARMLAARSNQPARVSPRLRGKAIAALGPAAVVPVLEWLVLARDARPREARAALDHALVVLADPRAVPHLVARMGWRRDETERAAAAHALAWHKAPEALLVFARWLRDPACPPGLASSCVRGLILLGTPESAEILERVAASTLDPQLGIVARDAAAGVRARLHGRDR
jgi:hypothetical protein